MTDPLRLLDNALRAAALKPEEEAEARRKIWAALKPLPPAGRRRVITKLLATYGR